MTRRLANAVTGPRGRWVTIAVWLAIGVAGLLAHAHLNEVTAAGQSSFLPADAESTRALDRLEQSQQSGEEVPTVIVFERNGGLTGADLDAIGRYGRALNRMRIVGATPIIDPFSAETAAPLGEVAKIAKGIGPISRDGEAALIVLALDAADRGAIEAGVRKIRGFLSAHSRPGLNTYVTGPGGIAADLERVADEAGRTLLIATLSLVLILLLAVYRAPLLALLPLVTVGIAYLVATGIAYLLIEAGWIVVNAEGTFLLLVLVFGAGTDYSLLLVHRYREELGTGAAAGVGPAAGAGGDDAGDRRLGRDRDRGDAGAPRRRPAVDALARPDPGDRDRDDARGGFHPAAGAALGARRARLLARAAIAWLEAGPRPKPSRGIRGGGSPAWCAGARGR